MERHIGECDECRRLLAGLRRMLDALHRLPAPRATADAAAARRLGARAIERASGPDLNRSRRCGGSNRA